jgi:hypothetical protein
MKRKKMVIWGTGMGLLFCLFFMREFWVANNSLRVFGEENFTIVQTPSGDTLFWGEENAQKNVLLRAIQSHLFPKEPFVIQNQEIGTTAEGDDWTLVRISEHIARGTFVDSTVWFYGSPIEEELTVLKSTPILLESDFWILEKNNYPDFLPLPTQAILTINERKPSQKLESFAREKNIPLVSVKETGGFILGLQDQEWEFQSR